MPGVTGLDRVTVAYPDGSIALRDITLLVEPGELLAVLGPSGSGKSSMLRAISGLLPIKSGQVLIDGAPAAREPSDRNVAFVFEDGQLVPFMDVARNMGLSLRFKHVPREEEHEQVEKQARGLGMSGLLRRRPHTLSRGESSRAGIGRALVRTPSVFLLDEPLAHLDAAERVRVRQHIREVVKEAGAPTIYVTHDSTEALSVGDRVAVISDGRLLQVAPPRELYDAPADTLVAEFVSTTPLGLLPATVVASGGTGGYRTGGYVLPTWRALPDALSERVGETVRLGLRAEDVYERPQPDHGTVTGVVSRAELLGRQSLVAVEVAGARLYCRFDARSEVARGDTVTVGVDAARAHVFDAATGVALAHPEV